MFWFAVVIDRTGISSSLELLSELLEELKVKCIPPDAVFFLDTRSGFDLLDSVLLDLLAQPLFGGVLGAVLCGVILGVVLFGVGVALIGVILGTVLFGVTLGTEVFLGAVLFGIEEAALFGVILGFFLARG